MLNDQDGHEIAGKKVDPKLATPQSSKNDQNEEKSSKVFVGGIEKGTTKEDITAAFAGRGNVCFQFHVLHSCWDHKTT